MVELKILLPSDIEFQELCSFQGTLFSDWLHTWKQLSPDEADPFTHPVWTISWLHAFGRKNVESYRLYVLYSGADFVTAIPFQLKEYNTPIGKQYYLRHPYNKFSSGASLALRQENYANVFAKIFATPVKGARKPLMVQFDKVDAANRVLSSELNISVSRVKPRYALCICENHTENLKRLSKAFQRNLRRYDRKLDALRSARIEFYDEAPELFAAFEEFVQLEASGWKGKAASAVESDEAARSYYSKAIEGFCNSSEVTIALVKAAGDCIAASVNYRKDDTLYGLKTTYNEDYSKLAPGHVLLNRCIEMYCIGNKIRVLNAVHNPKWIEVWRPYQLPTYRLQVFPFGMRGLCARSLFFPFWNIERGKRILIRLHLWEAFKQTNWEVRA